jgi:hypothetical protein
VVIHSQVLRWSGLVWGGPLRQTITGDGREGQGTSGYTHTQVHTVRVGSGPMCVESAGGSRGCLHLMASGGSATHTRACHADAMSYELCVLYTLSRFF